MCVCGEGGGGRGYLWCQVPFGGRVFLGVEYPGGKVSLPYRNTAAVGTQPTGMLSCWQYLQYIMPLSVPLASQPISDGPPQFGCDQSWSFSHPRLVPLRMAGSSQGRTDAGTHQVKPPSH